jgi:ubiquinone/menaquinone biosynthesis C-methylase UbiE
MAVGAELRRVSFLTMGVRGATIAMRGARRARWSRRALLLLSPAGPSAARKLAQQPVLEQGARHGPPQGRCLNAGSGKLGLYNDFLESFEEVTEIVNLDIEQPEISARRADARHTDVLGSVTELPFENESFDWVLCTNVLPLIEDDRRAAAELGRVLKRDGFALVSVRTPRAPITRYQVAEYPATRPREGYSLKQLSTLLTEAGLEPVWHSYSYHLPMTLLFILAQWQHRKPDGLRRVLMPRFVALALGHADRQLRIGRASDLTVLAKRA